MVAGLIVAALVLALRLAPATARRQSMITVTTEQQLASALNTSRPVLLIFRATDCVYCHVLDPYAEQYAQAHPGVEMVNVELNLLYSNDPGLVERLVSYYDIQGTPTELVIYHGMVYGYHVGIWPPPTADQLPYIEQFVNSSLSGRPIAPALSVGPAPAAAGSPTSDLKYVSPAAALGVGALAAVSPCSIPMLALYSASSRRRALSRMALELALMTLGVAAFGALLAKVYSLSPLIESSLEGFAAGFSAFLGYELLRGRVVMLGGPAAAFAPLAGLECSLPFFVAAISAVAAAGLTTAIMSSIAFGAGYSAVYVGLSGAVGRAMSLSRRYGTVAGLTLVLIGVLLFVYVVVV